MGDLKPGRELDALIAEKVMGWKRLTYSQSNPNNKKKADDHRLTMWWHSEDLKEKALAEDDNDYYNPEPAWSPSTNIAQAWEVAKKMHQLGWILEIRTGYNIETTAPVHRVSLCKRGFDEYYVGIPNLDAVPHAICLAALKAVDK
jgi:hypothetical protein